MSIKTKLENKSNSDLKYMVNNPTEFQDSFINIAKEILDERGDEFDANEKKETNEIIKSIREEEERKHRIANQIIENLHPNLILASKLLIAIIILRLIRIPFYETMFGIGFIEIPYFGDILSMLFCVFSIVVFKRGSIGHRPLILLFFGIAVIMNIGLVFVFLSDGIFNLLGFNLLIDTVLKSICLYLLYASETRLWVIEITQPNNL